MESLHVWRKKTSRIFHYFSKKVYNEILFYNGKREKRGEIMEKREKKKVGEAYTVARERWLINSSHSFFNSGGGKHVLLSYWVKCCLPI